jgi:PAS domain S-box-containing protein
MDRIARKYGLYLFVAWTLAIALVIGVTLFALNRWMIVGGFLFLWLAGSTMLGVFSHRRLRADEILKRAIEDWERTFDAVPDMIAIVDADCTMRRVNRAMADRLGLQGGAAPGRACHVHMHKSDAPPPDCPHALLLKDGQEHTAELEIPHLGGWFDVSVSPLRDSRRNVVGSVHVIRDITERKRVEEERERLKAQLYQAQKMESVGRLAGGVAHDFNNMLNVILGYADLALAGLDAGDELSAPIRQIQKAGLRSAELTRQLLAFSRKQTALPVAVDMNEVIADQMTMLERMIGEDVRIDFVPAADLWRTWIDPSQLGQVLTNLSVNARDAMIGVGTITIETSNVPVDEADTRFTTDTSSTDRVLLSFSDTGSGMDKETMERIFEPFFTTKDEGKGTGLGLATVYGIVTQNEGVIHVSSEPGMGTHFRIYFPRHRGQAAQPAKSPEEVCLSGSETILVVEDEEQILTLATAMIERHGYKVLSAATPEEACRICGDYTGDIHLLLTDVVMPGMNGKELQVRIEAMKPGIRTLFMSGYTADVIAYRGVIERGVNFISKPFTLGEFAGKVRAVLDE